MAREKCGLLAVPRTAPVQLTQSAREGVLNKEYKEASKWL